MAKLIQAYSTYCPRIDLMEAVAPRHFMEAITRRTTLSAGVVKNVQESEVETLIGFLMEGRSREGCSPPLSFGHLPQMRR